MAPSLSHPPSPPSPHLIATHHPSDGHQTYSSQDVHCNHWPNQTHSQAMAGPNQPLAARNIRGIEYPPNIYVRCDTCMLAGRTTRIRGPEGKHRKEVRFLSPFLSVTRPEPLPLFRSKNHPTSLQIRCIQRSLCPRPAASDKTAGIRRSRPRR